MSVRQWLAPDMRTGTTIHLITDSHFGQRFFTQSWMEQTGTDMDRLKAFAHGHVHGGDLIQWQTVTDPATEDQQFLDWWAARKAADPATKWALTVGNHDLASYFGSLPRRDAATWASVYGVPSKNTVTDMGGVRVITVGPDAWDTPDAGSSVGDCVLSAATLTWLDQQLAATTKPVFVSSHAPLWEQYNGAGGPGWYVNPRTDIAAIVASRTNLVGWLSGHRHVDITLEPAHASVINVGGRAIYAINGPACSGRRNDLSFAAHQIQSPCLSTYITYLGDSVEVRWREHLRGRWFSDGKSRVKRLSL